VPVRSSCAIFDGGPSSIVPPSSLAVTPKGERLVPAADYFTLPRQDALMGHKPLNAEFTELLITGKVDTGGGGKYAYGFEDGRKDRI
jgi:hypothetical protein